MPTPNAAGVEAKGTKILSRIDAEIEAENSLSEAWHDYGDWDDCEWHEYHDGN